MQKNIDSVYYNYSGYYDPTAGEALGKVIQEEETAAEAAKVKKKRRERKRKRGKKKCIEGA